MALSKRALIVMHYVKSLDAEYTATAIADALSDEYCSSMTANDVRFHLGKVIDELGQNPLFECRFSLDDLFHELGMDIMLGILPHSFSYAQLTDATIMKMCSAIALTNVGWCDEYKNFVKTVDTN